MVRVPAYVEEWSVGTQDDWTYETTGASGEGVTLQSDRAECVAGGAAGDHTAFIQRDVVTTLGEPLTSKLIFDATLALPADFYTQKEGAVRLLEWNSTLVGGYGTSDANPMECYLEIDNSDLPSLVFRDNTQTLTVWTGTILAAGESHNVVIEWAPSKSALGSWSVNVDYDDQVGGAVDTQTVPTAILDADIEITTLQVGLVVADAQDSLALQVDVLNLHVTGWRNPGLVGAHPFWWAAPTSITTPTSTPPIVPSEYNLYHFNGTSWELVIPWEYNGATWDEMESLVRYYDGAAWQT